jgi:adenylate kinase
MKLIFVSGMADIDKAALIDLALQRSGRKNEFTLVDFNKICDISGDMEDAEDLGTARRMLSKFYEKIEKAMITRLKEQKGGILASGCLTFGTKYGYMGAVPDQFFRSFKPDLMVILEKADDTLEKNDLKTVEHQRINMYYGTIYSSVAGSALKIIKFRENKMIDAVAELSEIIKH